MSVRVNNWTEGRDTREGASSLVENIIKFFIVYLLFYFSELLPGVCKYYKYAGYAVLQEAAGYGVG